MTLRTPDGSWQDEELVRACLAGNQAAWVVLIEKYKKLVYSMPAKYQLAPEEAADVFQDVWAGLYRDVPRLERVEGLRGWLITAASRRCLLYKRRQQKTQQMEELDGGIVDNVPGIAEIHAEAEREQRIRDAISSLPPRCQKLVHMLFFEQPTAPYSDITRSLGLAEGSIGFIRGRCLAKLRKLLEERGI